MLFDSRGVLYAGRYVAALDNRADWYHSRQGYDVATWLNQHIKPGERVALANYKGHRYFIRPEVLQQAESEQELQWLWQNGRWLYGGSSSITPVSWRPDFWNFYVDRKFTYVVVTNGKLAEALAAWPKLLAGKTINAVASGHVNTVIKIGIESLQPVNLAGRATGEH
jgi:hypothetical protein